MTKVKHDMSCPLCGHRFTESELACHTSCPFGESCQVACCPECGYQMVKETKTVRWLRKILRRS